MIKRVNASVQYMLCCVVLRLVVGWSSGLWVSDFLKCGLYVGSVGVRVMDTSWVKGKSSCTLARKASSTPPSAQPPGSPADTLITEQPGELATSPIPTPPPGDRGR